MNCNRSTLNLLPIIFCILLSPVICPSPFLYFRNNLEDKLNYQIDSDLKIEANNVRHLVLYQPILTEAKRISGSLQFNCLNSEILNSDRQISFGSFCYMQNIGSNAEVCYTNEDNTKFQIGEKKFKMKFEKFRGLTISTGQDRHLLKEGFYYCTLRNKHDFIQSSYFQVVNEKEFKRNGSILLTQSFVCRSKVASVMCLRELDNLVLSQYRLVFRDPTHCVHGNIENWGQPKLRLVGRSTHFLSVPGGQTKVPYRLIASYHGDATRCHWLLNNVPVNNVEETKHSNCRSLDLPRLLNTANGGLYTLMLLDDCSHGDAAPCDLNRMKNIKNAKPLLIHFDLKVIVEQPYLDLEPLSSRETDPGVAYFLIGHTSTFRRSVIGTDLDIEVIFNRESIPYTPVIAGQTDHSDIFIQSTRANVSMKIVQHILKQSWDIFFTLSLFSQNTVSHINQHSVIEIIAKNRFGNLRLRTVVQFISPPVPFCHLPDYGCDGSCHPDEFLELCARIFSTDQYRGLGITAHYEWLHNESPLSQNLSIIGILERVFHIQDSSVILTGAKDPKLVAAIISLFDNSTIRCSISLVSPVGAIIANFYGDSLFIRMTEKPKTGFSYINKMALFLITIIMIPVIFTLFVILVLCSQIRKPSESGTTSLNTDRIEMEALKKSSEPVETQSRDRISSQHPQKLESCEYDELDIYEHLQDMVSRNDAAGSIRVPNIRSGSRAGSYVILSDEYQVPSSLVTDKNDPRISRNINNVQTTYSKTNRKQFENSKQDNIYYNCSS